LEGARGKILRKKLGREGGDERFHDLSFFPLLISLSLGRGR